MVSEDESTQRYYDERADEFIARTDRYNLTSLYEPFCGLLPPNATILDAGCGGGRDVAAFMARGYRVTAIDASATMVARTTQRTGVPARRLRFQELDYDQQFDGIWACASLLHVPTRELPDVLARFRNALKLGGVCFVSFKHGTGERTVDGRRFTDLTPESLQTLVAAVDELELLRTWPRRDLSSDGDTLWVNGLLRRVAARSR